jgi:hypothetical protein
MSVIGKIKIGDIVRLFHDEKYYGIVIEEIKDEWVTILWFNTPNIIRSSYPIRKVDKIS